LIADSVNLQIAFKIYETIFAIVNYYSVPIFRNLTNAAIFEYEVRLFMPFEIFTGDVLGKQVSANECGKAEE